MHAQGCLIGGGDADPRPEALLGSDIFKRERLDGKPPAVTRNSRDERDFKALVMGPGKICQLDGKGDFLTPCRSLLRGVNFTDDPGGAFPRVDRRGCLGGLYGDGGSADTKEEQKDLIAFLESLTGEPIKVEEPVLPK